MVLDLKELKESKEIAASGPSHKEGTASSRPCYKSDLLQVPFPKGIEIQIVCALEEA